MLRSPRVRAVLLKQSRMIDAEEHHENQPDVEGAVFGDMKGVFGLVFEDAEVFGYNLFACAGYKSTGICFSELG